MVQVGACSVTLACSPQHRVACIFLFQVLDVSSSTEHGGVALCKAVPPMHSRSQLCAVVQLGPTHGRIMKDGKI